MSFPLREFFKRLKEIFDVGLSTRSSEATLTSLRNTVSANDYGKLTIDLGIARTDVVIATLVHGFRVMAYSTGAVFTLKLIDATKSGLTQADLPVGAEITDFEPTNLLLTNTAQAGLSLTLLVFRRV